MTASTDEDELHIPAHWAKHLDGRPRGRLSVARAEAVLDDPWVDGARHYNEVLRDRVDAPYTFVAELGAEALPLLEEFAPIGDPIDAAEGRAIAEAMAVIPTDEAFVALLERATQSVLAGPADFAAQNERHYAEALTHAIARFPARAIRTLAPRAVGRGAAAERYRALLTTAVRRAPRAAEAALTALEGEARAQVEGITAELRERRVATSEDLPRVLREPPWTQRKKKKAKPKTLALAPLPFESAMAWLPGEREKWAQPGPDAQALTDCRTDADWERARTYVGTAAAFLALAPEALAERDVRRWAPVHPELDDPWLRPIVARWGLRVLPGVTGYALAHPKRFRVLLPYRERDLALSVARAYARLTSAREAAQHWLLRHPEAAAIGLIPAALGANADAAKHATEALTLMLREGQRALIEDVAQRYGDEALASLRAILDADPLDDHPARLPAMPAFWHPAALPPPELNGGKGALPVEALAHLAAMLAFSKPGAVYEGVRMVAEACTSSSLARFSWALFESWLQAGAPMKEKWAFWQLAWLGDDEHAHRLARVMKDWPRQGAAARAVLGLQVLGDMPSDVALLLVHQIANRAGYPKSLRKAAQKRIAEIAVSRGLSEEELADRLVPTLELDEHGSMVLDYGPRSFHVGFDEQLRPVVRDANGDALKALPKPGKSDDPTLAPAAEKRFKDLKKNVRTVASAQVRRFEEAMRTERRWGAGELVRWIVEHPLLVHLARRLVWGAYEGERLIGGFRVAEDRTFADVSDEPFALPEHASVGVVHAIELDEATRARWSEVLADYTLLQPFAQLARELHAPAGGVSREAHAEALLGAELEAVRAVALEARGWQRGPVGDSAIFDRMERRIGGGFLAAIELSPGIVAGMVQSSERQRARLHLSREGSPVALDDLSPVLFSELMRDLSALFA